MSPHILGPSMKSAGLVFCLQISGSLHYLQANMLQGLYGGDIIIL